MARVREALASSQLRRGTVGTALGLAGIYAFQVVKYRRAAGQGLDLAEPPTPGSAEFARLIEVMTGSPLREGNRVQVLRNGTTLHAMLEAISSAEETINFSSYIYWPGGITDQFSDALCQRAVAGVVVNVLVDGYGSAKLDREHVDRLKQAGVNVVIFRPPRWHDLRKLNNRMHRRILVVDGQIGFAGGVGIADMWTGNAEDPDHWRESHLRIEGPAVRDLVGGFAENWTEATGSALTGSHIPDHARFDAGVAVQVTKSSPTGGAKATADLFHAAIAGARRRLWLTTAYFTGGRAFIDALCAAAARGVDVRVLVNGQKVDKEVARQTGQRSYGKLLECGVRIFEYQKTMLHAKVLLVDDGWVNVGSSNFDHRSFALDIEFNVALPEPTVAAEFEKHFFDDLDDSEEIELDSWQSRPLRKRAGEWAGELVRQSL